MSKTLKKRDGDIVFLESRGTPYYINGVHKLSQDCADSLMTEYDSSRGFGSQLADLNQINSNLAGPLGMINRGHVKTLVRDALERLRQLQLRRHDQLDATEAVKTIGTIRVTQFSKTGYIFNVNVSPQSGDTVDPFSFLIQLRHQFLPGQKPLSGVLTDNFRRI